eukprot:5329230-Ditylum_brightwellii.AAC.1
MVLKSEFNSEDLDKLQKIFIQHCKLETSDNVIGKKIAKEQWKGKAAKYLGNFKALLRRFAESPDTDKGREMFRKREDIFEAH